VANECIKPNGEMDYNEGREMMQKLLNITDTPYNIIRSMLPKTVSDNDVFVMASKIRDLDDNYE